MTDSLIRTLVRSRYDLQDLRIETGNRLIANFRAKLGIEPDEEAEGDAKALMQQLQKEHKRLTDGVAKITARRSYDFDGVITEYVELRMVDRYITLVNEETQTVRDIARALRDVDIWTEFLEDVTGVGPSMAGVIISEMDPHKAPYPSSFWSYAGLDVVDGEGRSRKKEHMKTVEYVNSDGEEDTRKSLGYNPFLKTKLMGVLGPSFLRASSDYRDHYDRYRHRKETDPDWDDASDGHLHQASLRYMVKQFLIDLHIKWRDLEDLPVSKPYHAAKQGKRTHDREATLGVTDPKRFDE
jgi:ribosomal protein S10